MSTIIILFLISRTRVVLDRVMPNDTRRQSYLYTIVDTVPLYRSVELYSNMDIHH